MEQIPTGINALDEALGGGVKRQSLTILSAHSGFGKTALAANIAANCAAGKRSVSTIYFTNDACVHHVYSKMIASVAKVPHSDIANILFDCEKCAPIRKVASRLKKAPLAVVEGNAAVRLCDICGASASEMIPWHIGQWPDMRPELIIIDHLLLVRDNSKKFRSTPAHLRAILSKLKHLAVKLDAAVVVVCPLYRKQGKPLNPKEYATALKRLIGSLDYCDSTIFLIGKSSFHKHKVGVIVDTKSGPAAGAILDYDPERALFYDSEPESQGKVECCGECRFANHGTGDAREGLLACYYGMGVNADWKCRQKDLNGRPLFEKYDGHNGVWLRRKKHH